MVEVDIVDDIDSLDNIEDRAVYIVTDTADEEFRFAYQDATDLLFFDLLIDLDNLKLFFDDNTGS